MQNKKMITGTIVAVVVLVLIIVLARSGSKSEKVSTNDASQTQAGGLVMTTLVQGSGVASQAGDTVSMNYTGKLTDGTAFDSNVDPKFGHVEPFTFTLGQNQVIQGWEQGILGMKVGEKRHLSIPPELAYGARGAGSAVPPNATLEFDVELVSITPGQK